jgi:DNA-binding CsgD family transcriptional regulator
MGTKTASVVKECPLREARDSASCGGLEGQELLARSWCDLVAGRARVSRMYSDASRHYIELVAGNTQPRLRDLEFLVPVLLGRPQKVVAAEACCSTSSVATAAARCLHAMGVERHTRDVPMIVVMMAHAFHGRNALSGVNVRCELADDVRTVISASRPEAELDHLLSPGEREVMRRRIEGFSYEDIARERNTSLRTVANQIASACSKLRISGRLALFGLLLCDRNGPADPGGSFYDRPLVGIEAARVVSAAPSFSRTGQLLELAARRDPYAGSPPRPVSTSSTHQSPKS